MTQGKYLFSLYDGNGNSYWGVFNLEGLKRLEEDMNTKCIIDELDMEVKFKGGKVYGPIDWAREWTKMEVNKVPDDVRYTNVFYHDLDLSGIKPGFFPPKDGSTSPSKSHLSVGASGDINKSQPLYFGQAVNASRDKLERGGEDIITNPIKINTLWVADHHWANIYSVDGKSEGYFINRHTRTPDEPIMGYRHKDPSLPINLETNPWVPVTLKDIQPYISSIIDSGAPKGFLKILNDMKKEQGKEKQWPIATLKKKDPAEKGLDDLLDPLLNELFLIPSSAKHWPPMGSAEWGESGSQQRKDLLERMKKQRQEDAQPLLSKIEGILKSYKGRVPQEYLDQKSEEYEIYRQRLYR
jgi:hypothetical protein